MRTSSWIQCAWVSASQETRTWIFLWSNMRFQMNMTTPEKNAKYVAKSYQFQVLLWMVNSQDIWRVLQNSRGSVLQLSRLIHCDMSSRLDCRLRLGDYLKYFHCKERSPCMDNAASYVPWIQKFPPCCCDAQAIHWNQDKAAVFGLSRANILNKVIWIHMFFSFCLPRNWGIEKSVKST